MPLKTDFDKMTLDELTPIVSMRPGKEYTKEELRLARLAFMEKLGCANPEVDADAEVDYTEPMAEEVPSFSIPKEEGDLPLEPIAPIGEIENKELSAESVAEISVSLEEPHITETPGVILSDSVPSEPESIEPAEVKEEEKEEEPAEVQEKHKEAHVCTEKDAESILKSDSRLAKFLRSFYSFFLLPVLAIESIGLLLACVGTCVSTADTSYAIIYVLCSSVYALLIGLTWHQFLCRSELGLLLNRTLICVCVLRGFMMLLSKTDVLMGIIFIALSALFLVYFIAYDTMLTAPQTKQRVR